VHRPADVLHDHQVLVGRGLLHAPEVRREDLPALDGDRARAGDQRVHDRAAHLRAVPGALMLPATFPRWHAHIDVWLLVAGLLVAYFWALRRIGPKHVEPFEFTATRRQKVQFVLGCLVILIAADWPIHDLAERALYSVHM